MKTSPVGAKLFHADGQTMTKLIVASRNFSNSPEIQAVNAVQENKSWVRDPHRNIRTVRVRAGITYSNY